MFRARTFFASQEIRRNLRNQDIYRHVSSTTPLVPIRSVLRPPLFYLFQIRFNIILQIKPGSTKWSYSLKPL